MNNSDSNRIKDLTLLLLFLTAWEEKNPLDNEPFLRSWRGYDFDALRALEDESMIAGFGKAKSVGITKEGRARAQELARNICL